MAQEEFHPQSLIDLTRQETEDWLNGIDDVALGHFEEESFFLMPKINVAIVERNFRFGASHFYKMTFQEAKKEILGYKEEDKDDQ